MNLEFGVVYNYYPKKGFGIVTNPLSVLKDNKTFFHISSIKKSNIHIFNKISNFNSNELIYFWYEFELTPNGIQIKRVISQNELKNFIKTTFQNTLFKEYYFPKLKKIWLDIESKEPVWLNDISLNVFDKIELENLKKQKESQIEIQRIENERLIKIKAENEEIQRLENERLKKIKEEEEEIKRTENERLKKIKEEEEEIKRTENVRLKKIKDEEEEIKRTENERLRMIKSEEEKNQRIENERLKKLKDDEEEKEFELLVAEVASKGFTLSSQVSSYIVRNKLGNKYKHISGILTMRNESSEWNFNGGFPPKIYAMLCERLGLGNNGSHSQVLDFKAFKDL